MSHTSTNDTETTYDYLTENDLESLGSTEEITIKVQWDKRDPVQEYSFKGELLGTGSSNKATHTHPEGANPTPEGKIIHCSGCRWTEIKIYQQYIDAPKGLAYGQYIVVIEGYSVFSFDTHRTRAIWADEPNDVIAGLCSNKGRNSEPRMTFIAREALREAAKKDLLLSEDFAVFERLSPADY